MDIPPGIVVSVQGRTLTVKGPNGLLEKALPQAVEVMVEGSAVTVKTSAKKQTRPVRAKVNAVVAHLRNMIRGVSTPYEKKLQLVYSHFPVTLDVKPGFIFILAYILPEPDGQLKRVGIYGHHDNGLRDGGCQRPHGREGH